MFKSIAAYLSYVPKRLAASAAIVSLAALIPFASIAQEAVRLEAALGVLNVTDGQTSYATSTSAGYGDVVQVQLWYHNMENEDSGLIAQNLKASIKASEGLGSTQTISSTISADNGNTVNSQVTVNLERSDAKLEFVPGTVRWRHNAGTNQAPNYVTETITDEVVTGQGGVVIENAQPCFNFEATITAQFRVIVPAIEFEKSVGSIDNPDAGWQQNLSVKPGEKLQYLFSFKNIGNDVLHNVVVRDQLPAGVTYVPGSTWLQNPAVPDGTTLSDDNIINSTGVNIGDYAPGAWAYVIFDVVVDDVDAFECGQNTMRNVGQVYSDETGIYEDDATTDLTRKCEEQPVFSCDSLTVADLGNRAFRFTTEATAENGATINQYVYNFGDGSAELVTDDAVVDHAYQNPGTYTTTVRVIFNVGETQEEDECTVQVTVPEVPVTPPSTPPAEGLPVTGPAGVIAGVFGTGVLGAGVHGWIISRRNLRSSALGE